MIPAACIQEFETFYQETLDELGLEERTVMGATLLITKKDKRFLACVLEKPVSGQDGIVGNFRVILRRHTSRAEKMLIGELALYVEQVTGKESDLIFSRPRQS